MKDIDMETALREKLTAMFNDRYLTDGVCINAGSISNMEEIYRFILTAEHRGEEVTASDLIYLSLALGDPQ